jgi:glycosyltransferase involved in cell wall biosynthesis
MDILHIDNMASVAHVLVHGLRKRGHNALLIAVSTPTQMPPDVAIEPAGPMSDPVARKKTMLKEFLEIRKRVPDFDIIHIHGGTGIPGMYYWLKRKMDAKKRIVIHYHGTDLREGTNIHFSSIADLLLVSTPDLLRHRDKVGGRKLVHLPNPVLLSKLKPVDMKKRAALTEKDRIVISHLPSHRKVKGTDNILKAVNRLKKRFPLEMDLIENTDHEEAMRRMAASDICVDWVSKDFDIYGVVSIEAMALGIPTVCRFNPDYYSPPLQNCEPKEVEKRIVELITDRDLYLDLSKSGKVYVKKVHDNKKVVQRLIGHYESIL